MRRPVLIAMIQEQDDGTGCIMRNVVRPVRVRTERGECSCEYTKGSCSPQRCESGCCDERRQVGGEKRPTIIKKKVPGKIPSLLFPRRVLVVRYQRVLCTPSPLSSICVPNLLCCEYNYA